MISAELEREAQKIVKPYLTQTGVAWPTVFLGFGCVAAFLTVMTLGFMGIMPLWVGLILNSLILYAIQTPLHDAVHRSISGRNKSWLWLNHLVGFLCGAVLLHEYRAFRVMHTIHHRETNNPEFDPDVWIFAKTPLGVVFKCFTISLLYHFYFFKNIFLKKEYRADVIHIIGVYMVLYSIIFWGSVFGYAAEFILMWYIPHFIASAMIIYFFGYLVHPEEHEERYLNTKIIEVKGRYAPLINMLWFFQSFHLIHHLFPRMPFYLYPRAYRDLKPLLLKAGSPIVDLKRDEETGALHEVPQLNNANA